MLMLSDSLPNPTINSLDRNFPQASKVRLPKTSSWLRSFYSPRFSAILNLFRFVLFPITSARTVNRTDPLPHGQTAHPFPKERHFRSRGRWTGIL
jgi:hypothetical protein